MNTRTTVAPPSRLLQWLEWRAIVEYAHTALASPWLSLAPRGDGHSVIVLPGLVADDGSTELLRRYLRGRSYEVHGWGQGRNYGPREGVPERMLQQVDRLHAASGRKLSLIGWSLGGVYARMLAHERPDAVRSVTMLGSPIGGHHRASNAWRLYEWTSGRRADDTAGWPQPGDSPAVPTSSIWSRGDGVVAWQNSVHPPAPRAENIEVHASHTGLGVNAAVLYAVADRLAQPEGQWQPFAPPATLRLLYPSARR